MTARSGILYISYDGMLEPLGQSQVIAYLERLADGFDIVLMSYEKDARRDQAGRQAIATRLSTAGIRWHPLRYHKRPTVPATALDIAQGIVAGTWLAWRHKVGIIHARSLVPALIGRAIRPLARARLLFDMRGFWAQERVDGKLWRTDGWLFRGARMLEHDLVARADHVVTLTEASRPVIVDMGGAAPPRPVTVIPTCADLDRFSPATDMATGPFTLGYVGSVGTWYLFDDVLRFFRVLLSRRPDAHLLVVNRGEHARIRDMAAQAGIDGPALELASANHADVPGLIRRMDAGVALVRPLASKRASAPTKLAEYLGCGVPVLGNAGIGDMGALLDGEGVGIVLTTFTDAALTDAADRLLMLCATPRIADRCRAAATRHFSLERGVDRYRAVYRTLLA